MDDNGAVELRGLTPKWVADLLDAVAIARGDGSSRMDVANQVLAEWSKKKIHEASVIQRITRGNGVPSDAVGCCRTEPGKD